MKKVSMYTLSTCPWCAKAKQFLVARSVPFESIDYDLADATTQNRIVWKLGAHGARGFPFVMIGEHVVAGYDPVRYAALLLME